MAFYPSPAHPPIEKISKKQSFLWLEASLRWAAAAAAALSKKMCDKIASEVLHPNSLSH